MGNAFVEEIGLNVGCKVEDVIETYLNLNMQDLTQPFTVVNMNGIKYPIGYFNEENIELFKLGVITVNNISTLINRDGHKALDDECQRHTNYFIDQLFEKYDNPYYIESILRGFSKISEARGESLLTDEQWENVKERANEKIETRKKNK